jgi:hypothetical protein
MSRPWDDAEDYYLRQWYHRKPLEDVAFDLDRTGSGVKQRARKLGLSAGRFLTPAEIRFIQQHYHKLPTVKIAARLRRSVDGIRRAAVRHGAARHLTPTGEAFGEFVREKVAAGWCNSCIVRAWHERFHDTLPMHKGTAEVWRIRLGLPPSQGQTTCQPCKERTRETTRRQLAAAGLPSIGWLRVMAFREFARDNGWPEELYPREVQILNALAARGVPMTRLELAQAIGTRTDRIGCNHSPALLIDSGRYGTYTAGLTKRGYLIRMRNAVRGGRTKGCHDLYALGPVAIGILERRAACLKKTESAGKA